MAIFSSYKWDYFPRETRRQRLMKFMSWVEKVSTALILTSLLFPIAGECSPCSLPESWNGRWFINEFANNIESTLNSSTNSINDRLGNCIWQKEDMFIFRNSQTKCSKCVLITARDRNVLFSKETDCVPDEYRDQDDPGALCNEFSADSEHYYWFRTDYKAINCPFGETAFQFTYKNGGGEKCKQPVSHSSSCIENTKMKLQFEACPDNKNSAGKVEQITCVGNWTEDDYGYLLADISTDRGHQSLQDRFRCFTYWKNSTTPKVGKPPIVTGYIIGTSDWATCSGLNNPEAAETTMYFEKKLSTDSEEKPCSFPAWFAAHHWIDMGKTVKFQLPPEHKNRSVHIHPLRHNQEDSPNLQLTFKRRSFFPLSHSSLACLEKMNISSDNDEHVALVAKYTVGCTTDIICLHIIKRSEYIFQMYHLERSDDMDRATLREACFKSNLSELQKGATMISTNGTLEACPYPGKYMPIQPLLMNPDKLVDLHSSSNGEWSIGCNKTNKLHDILPSPNDVAFDHFSCMDSWNEVNSSYTILLSSSTTNKEYSKPSIIGNKLYCVINDITGLGSVSSDSKLTLVITSQDCIQISENDTLNENNEVGLNGDEYYRIELYRTAYCNSTIKDDKSDTSPKLEHPFHQDSGAGNASRSTKEDLESGASSIKAIKWKPVHYCVILTLIVTVYLYPI